MGQQEKSPSKDRGCLPISVASIGCIGTIIAAIIGGVFAVIAAMAGNGSYVTTPSSREFNTQPAFENLTVAIEGPATAILGQRTDYTIISTNAVRLVWTITGFDFDEKNVVDNVDPQHGIWVEPTKPDSVGNTFTIQVVAYDTNGRSETAEKHVLVATE